MKTKLYVGQPQLRGALSKYTVQFNLLELRADRGRIPRPTLLRRWVEEVNGEFVFSVVFPRQVGGFGTEFDTTLGFGLEVAAALHAKWVVVPTEPAVGPSQRSRERLSGLFHRLSDEQYRVAWEPHGVWQDEQALEWSREFGVHLVRDISRGDSVREQTIYSRIPGLGVAARLSLGALEKAAESIVSANETYLVLGGEGAAQAARTLRSIVKDAEQWAQHDGEIAQRPFVFDEDSDHDEDTEDADSDEFDDEEDGEEAWDEDSDSEPHDDDDWEDEDAEDSDDDSTEEEPTR